jgi:hypothetical protein
MASFMQPILDLVLEFTGMPCSFVMGGPEPADSGRLNVIRYVIPICFYYSAYSNIILSMHSGSIKGPVKMNFGEHPAYKERVVPVFSDFLRKCFGTSISLIFFFFFMA